MNKNSKLAHQSISSSISKLSEKLSYRQSFGLENPPPGTKVSINFLEGCNYSIIWDDCPDGENIIEGWFKKKQQAIDYVIKNGWIC